MASSPAAGRIKWVLDVTDVACRGGGGGGGGKLSKKAFHHLTLSVFFSAARAVVNKLDRRTSYVYIQGSSPGHLRTTAVQCLLHMPRVRAE